MDRPISTEELEDDKFDASLRPQILNDFIGQKHLKDNLSIFIQAAKGRKEPLDHVLFTGPPGLGKTTLSQIIAKELGVGFRSTSGPVITKAGDLAAILTNLQPHDVLFIDEIHRLTPSVEEILYPAMEDFKLDILIGEGPSARTITIDLPPFTLVGATTRAGLITRPLRERFGIPLQLNFYEIDELTSIVNRMANLISLPIQESGAVEVAKRSRGTPRIAKRLTKRLRDFMDIYHQGSAVDAMKASVGMDRLGVDQNGLDAMDRKYLSQIAEFYSGGPVGIETISASLAEQRDVVEDVIEPYLMQQGYIQRSPRGRILSGKAYEFLGLTPPDILALGIKPL
ncbi:MAG: Holliday junction branch migration DNA helicase RuvB [Candidatus Paracaedibacteraceae bacterium]|nr:Holliday junction branch migration DNA helicase RuvB [Candidatus Paracaedibacteraceae bacterium]